MTYLLLPAGVHCHMFYFWGEMKKSLKARSWVCDNKKCRTGN